ncbi:hypothetical protein [Hoeflea poritis]|uniref:YjiS-like domain-containing protein n=1 Tax=Hoeflea poritis TaxID=2993659 RepID=A0ABT4VJ68_9HYPH|nr:hypothetical protein [Hoeflea poritis]MDA4844705.1 hypothetical protein [Hoeflea poritis]
MLNNARMEFRNTSGLTVVPAKHAVRTPLVSRLVEEIRTRWKRYQCARLHRQTEKEIAKLSDHMLHDIGWPARYDKRESCRRVGL